MEIHLDSSSLNLAILQRKVGQVIATARHLGAELFVASPVIDELLDGTHDERLRNAAADLMMLLDSGLFRISAGLSKLLQEEVARPVRATPIATREFRRGYRVGFSRLARMRHPTDALGDLRANNRALKDDWEPQDVALGEQLREKFKLEGMTLRNVGDELDGLRSGAAPRWLVDHVLQMRSLKSALTVEDVQRDPHRYRCTVAWASLTCLWMVARAVPSDYRNQHPALEMLKPGRNDLLDAQIASEAAYGDVFVVEDNSLRARCQFLRERGLLKFRSMKLDEFLASPDAADGSNPHPHSG